MITLILNLLILDPEFAYTTNDILGVIKQKKAR